MSVLLANEEQAEGRITLGFSVFFNPATLPASQMRMMLSLLTLARQGYLSSVCKK
jgi:hypothetical protein